MKAILHDFRAERELELANGVRILRRNPSDDTLADPPFGEPSLADFYALSESGISVEDNELTIEETVVLLWLFKPGPVWLWFFFVTDGGLGFGSEAPLRPPPVDGPYILTAEECDRFERFVSYFAARVASLTKANKRYLRRGLERFENAVIRNREHLALTDLVIALEGLLVEKGSDLTYKLALRTALLTGTSGEERLKVFNDMKKAYSFRSAYVHGDDVKFGQIGALPGEIRRYFANAVIRFLDLPQDQPADVGEDQRSRSYLDRLALGHDGELRIAYPDWWCR